MKRRKYIFLFLVIFITLYIFSCSLKTASESSISSGRIIKLVKPLLVAFGVKKENYSHVVRKAAHIIEFAAQGFALSLFFDSTVKKIKGNVVNVMFAGLLTACIDEAIQLFFDGRAGMIQDVFIDFSGNILGLLSFLLVLFLINKLARKI